MIKGEIPADRVPLPGDGNFLAWDATCMTADEVLQRYADGRREFRGIVLRDANLTGAALPGINLDDSDLRGVDLRGANLGGSSLLRANLQQARLYQMKARHADLRWADLRSADLRWACLSHASLANAKLAQASLPLADLRDANVRHADLRWADLSGAVLCGAELQAVRSWGATLHRTDLAGARLSCALQFVVLRDAAWLGARHGARLGWRWLVPHAFLLGAALGLVAGSRGLVVGPIGSVALVESTAALAGLVLGIRRGIRQIRRAGSQRVRR